MSDSFSREGTADKKLARYPHLVDRLYKTLKFEQFNQDDITDILQQITDLEFTPDAINYLATRTNQFRQLVKLINKIEKLSETNKIQEIDEYTLKGILNERRILTRALCREETDSMSVSLRGKNEVSELVPVKNLTECRFAGGKS